MKALTMTGELPPRHLLYNDIESEYITRFKREGIVFSKCHEGAGERQHLIERLRSKGAVFRNGEASIHLNRISPACIACTGAPGSKTFLLSVQCHRNCYFCFNPHQADYEKYRVDMNDWEHELDLLLETGTPMTHVALTGGEPLAHRDEMLRFFKEIRKNYPHAHTRLYTSGDLLDIPTMKALEDTGLTEIRFSVKLDDPVDLRETLLATIRQAKVSIPQVMVEMPVIPETDAEMEELLRQLDEIGIFGINLLEFGFPLHRWTEFARRGFRIKNPPFEVLYDYSYAGGLPVWGSELLALRLLDFALDESLTLGIHYCSLANKHRDQIYTMNRPYAQNNPVYHFDEDDYFLKSMVVFGADCQRVRTVFEHLPFVRYVEDPTDASLQFNPRDRGFLKDVDVDLYVSYNVIEERADGPIIRELKLVPYAAEH
jgi:pyruvate formate-lyase activating enzyme-like uncharacterized protein